MKVRHYICVLIPGSFFMDHDVYEVKERNYKDFLFPKRAAAFYFYDIFEMEKQKNGETISFKSGKKNVSKMTYIGTILSPDQVIEKYGKDSVAYRNMVNNHFIGLVSTNGGGTVGLEKDDTVLSVSDVKFKGQSQDVAEQK